MQRNIIIGALVVVLLLVGLFIYQNQQGEPAEEEPKINEELEFTLNERLANQEQENNQETTMDESKLSGPPALPEEYADATQAVIKTNMGDITVEFYKEDSPKTVENFMALAASGYYDGIKFHRVIDNFMIQAGDPLSKDDSQKGIWGTGGPDYTFADEFNDHKIVKGSLAMANRGPNTNGSQFFIVTAEATPWLDGMHTNFGYVIEGMDVVDVIGQVATEGADQPVDSVIIEGIELK